MADYLSDQAFTAHHSDFVHLRLHCFQQPINFYADNLQHFLHNNDYFAVDNKLAPIKTSTMEKLHKTLKILPCKLAGIQTSVASLYHH